MKFLLNANAAEQIPSECLLVGILEDEALTGTAQRVDEASDGQLSQLLESGDLSASAKNTLTLHRIPGIAAQRVVVVGFGKRSALSSTRFHEICMAAGKVARTNPATTVSSALHELPLGESDDDAALRVELSLLALHHSDYIYAATKPKAATASPAIDSVSLNEDASDEANLERLSAIATGVLQARTLADLPPNICNPSYLEAEALTMAGQLTNVSAQILQEEQLQDMGMNALLAVGQGSLQGTRLIVLNYRGAGDDAPHVLVGKGVTFDSGGLSLKTREGMEQMKFDMGGAATVLGAFNSCARMKLPINLIAVVAAVENMPDGKAYRPGDVLTTYEGLTVEVLNTDAEGRLALCDALSWAKQEYKPQTIIDVATLTGACVVALGTQATGLMSHDDELAAGLLAAGQHTGDRAWRLPLWPEYQEQLNSPYADMKNIGGMPAGSITAGCFLQRFVSDQRWAHLDVAGSLWPGSSKKGSTGRPVRLLCQWLQDQCA
jgi:leucyl aminopeptidase